MNLLSKVLEELSYVLACASRALEERKVVFIRILSPFLYEILVLGNQVTLVRSYYDRDLFLHVRTDLCRPGCHTLESSGFRAVKYYNSAYQK